MQTCPLCKGTGKKKTVSFVNASKTILRSCSICKGKGKIKGKAKP